MKKLISFLFLSLALGLGAVTTPINNANIQLNGVAQSGVLAANSTGAANVTAAQFSAAMDLLASTRGSVLYKGASGWTGLNPGTSGYVLTSAGAGADPVWSPEGSVGTVTSFSAGNLSPLFTTNVATATTTPALTFTLSNASANRVFAGPSTGADAAPTFRALVTADMPSGTGDVIGPASSTNNAFARWDTTTGKLLKDSSDLTYSTPTMSVPDAFNVAGAGSLLLTAGGTNQPITLSPQGTGAINIVAQGSPVKSTIRLSGSTTKRLYITQNPTDEAFTNVGRTLSLISADGSGAGVSAISFGSSNGFAVYRANGTVASPTQPVASDILGNFVIGGLASTLTGFTNPTAQMQAVAVSNWSASNGETKLDFYTTRNGTTSNQLVFTMAALTSNSFSLTGGAGNMTITSGTGASRTLTLQTTTSGSAATDAVVIGANQIFTKVNGLTTAGYGVPTIVASPAISATKTANFTVLSFSPPGTAGQYRLGGVITTTSATNTGTVQFTVDYVDSQGTTHTADIISLQDAAGVIATTKTGASKEYAMVPRNITINTSATAIVIKVVVTGSVSYTVNATVEAIGF